MEKVKNSHISHISQAILLILEIIYLLLLVVWAVSCVISVSCFISLLFTRKYISHLYSQTTTLAVSKSPVVNRLALSLMVGEPACYLFIQISQDLLTGEMYHDVTHRGLGFIDIKAANSIRRLVK